MLKKVTMNGDVVHERLVLATNGGSAAVQQLAVLADIYSLTYKENSSCLETCHPGPLI